MPNKLYNILVPVDFTIKNKWAIAKAIEIANQMDCNIHLVNVVHTVIMPGLPVRTSLFTPYESFAERMNNYERLKELAAIYSNQLCGNGKIEISILEGDAGNTLAEYISKYDMDMVVLGMSRINLVQRVMSSVSISRLARKTNVPVLAVGASGLICHFKKISAGCDRSGPRR